MVQFSFLRPKESSPSAPRMRRHIFLLAFLALTAPILFEAVSGAVTHHPKKFSDTVSTSASPSLEEAMELLSSPRNFHGVVQWSSPDLLRLEAEEDEREPSDRPKNHMDAKPYPIKDRIPDVNSPQVKAWISEIDWSKVPNIPVAKGLKDSIHFPECPPKEKVNKADCWWSCDGCVAESDVMTCPEQNHWGLTYDDGPSAETLNMLSHLKSKKIKATFFIVGSRVLEYPEILKQQVAEGHHLAMHTWSHAGLTTLTNHQIVAEIKWSEKIIRDVTGLTMKYVRPPYGDTDNRVREILRQLGYSTVIWTLGWDTNDWRLLAHQIKTTDIMSTFTEALDNLSLVKSKTTGGLGGPITLEHDLIPETIELSKRIIPLGMARGLKPMSLAQCLNDPSPYQGPKGALATVVSGGTAQPVTTVPAVGAGSPMAAVDADKKGSTSATDGGSLNTSTSPSKVKSDATMVYGGLQTLGYAAMGLSAVASFMLTL